MAISYYVKALWDPEANVWYSESNVPGLVLSAETLDEFEREAQRLAPELLVDNVFHTRPDVFPPIEFKGLLPRGGAVAEGD